MRVISTSLFGLAIAFAGVITGCGSQTPSSDLTSEAKFSGTAPSSKDNPVLFQYFHWYLPNDGRLWQRLQGEASELARKGFTALWIPPAGKGAGGSQDVGYAVYDLYDLGEFDQKGSRRTKYGTKDELLAAIKSAHSAGLEVYADIVLNHRIGADRTKRVEAVEVNPQQRNEVISEPKQIDAWTLFDFPARKHAYSDFTWHWYHFDGVDWDQSRREPGKIYRFTANSKTWDPEVSAELGNYDFLLGADLDLEQPEVIAETKRWGKWFTEFTGIDGYRLDAVKHMKAGFTRDWLKDMRAQSSKPLFAVAEYFDYDVNQLERYLQAESSEGQQIALFDMPLHLNFYRASQANGAFNMANLLQGTLIQRRPKQALSFVDNHDTQALQALESPVADWFKPLAYAVILLREEGYPSVFFADYYGTRYNDQQNGQNREGSVQAGAPVIDELLYARHRFAYGPQNSYLDDPDLIGWTRAGTKEHPAGLAVLLSDGREGKKRMNVGAEHAGQCFRDLTKRRNECVTIDASGWGEFSTNGRSFSLWVPEAYGMTKP